MSIDSKTDYIPGDPILINDIISQLKSQGVFDQFRKECISDVDTKPAYQNLCHRVDGQVSSYLSDVRWGPDLNKNQLRESIRKFVNECSFVEPGISRIVDQLVNPRINTVLVPKVEDIVYQYIGIPRVERNFSNESPNKLSSDCKSENQESPSDKWKSKRNHENEGAWSDSSVRKSEDSDQIKKDSSSYQASSSDVKCEPRNDSKEKNEDIHVCSDRIEDEDSRAYSTIDSDEENLNDADNIDEEPSLPEISSKLDTETSASVESDHFIEVSDSRNNLSADPKNDEKLITDEETVDENTNSQSLNDSQSDRTDAKKGDEREPLQFYVPKTPTINYETSEESDDNNCLKLHESHGGVSGEQDGRSLVYDVVDFSCVDKIAQKIAKDNCDQEKEVSCDRALSMNGDSDLTKITAEIASKSKDEKSDIHQKDNDKDNVNKTTDVTAKDVKHRERKHSEHRREKHKSDKRDDSRDDRDRRSNKEKERSIYESSKTKDSKNRSESRDKTHKNIDEKDIDDEMSNKPRTRDDHKSHRSHDERKIRDKEERKHRSSISDDKRSKDEKSRDKRSKSEDAKEERRSKHDGDRSKDGKKCSPDDDKEKYKKGDGSETKKSSKSQCGSDEKKVRTDRRSSDRDSNGPSSSSNHSTHRSSSKTEKEKHSEKSKHSASLSSSHKFKKNHTIKSSSLDDRSKVASKTLPINCEENSIRKSKNEQSQSGNDHSDSNQILKNIRERGQSDTKLKPETNIKSSKWQFPTTQAKRGFEAIDTEDKVNILNDSLCDGRQSPFKICEKNQFEFGIKKPKIARNKSEFGKVVKLRREYKEKMKLLQQQGKENTNFVNKSCEEVDEKRILDRLSPPSTLKEALVDSKNAKNGIIKEMKISISRIDNSYTIVNGSCFIKDADKEFDCNTHSHEVEKNRILTETDSMKSGFNINSTFPEKQDEMFKIKVRHSDSLSTRKSQSKCVHSSKDLKQIKTDEIVECRISSSHSEYEDELDQETDMTDDELLRKMNVEEIIGCRTDSTRISYDSGVNNDKDLSSVDNNAPNSRTDDRRIVLFDENNKENVGSEGACCVNDSSQDITVKKNLSEVHYFEPSSPNNDFRKLVEKMAAETENTSLPNFSIELNYPKEYDVIFRSQLGATVKRIVNIENIQYDPANSKNTKFDTTDESIPRKEETVSAEFESMLQWNFDPSTGASLQNEKSCDSSYCDRITSEEPKNRVTVASKRKTLGIKRKISNINFNVNQISQMSESLPDSAANHNILPLETQYTFCPITEDNNSKNKKHKMASNVMISETEKLDRLDQTAFIYKNSVITPVNPDCFSLEVKKEENKKINSSSTDNPIDSCSPGSVPAKTVKKSRRNSPARSFDEQSSNEIVPKRTPYQNKCYYDSSDLYKPRPSFLASSRRSRGLNADHK